MKLQLTEKAKQQLEKLDYDVDYHESSKYDQLLQDAMLYVEGSYEDNEFDDLYEWCIRVGNSEYDQTYLNTHPNAVRENIDKMLRENIITIVE